MSANIRCNCQASGWKNMKLFYYTLGKVARCNTTWHAGIMIKYHLKQCRIMACMSGQAEHCGNINSRVLLWSRIFAVPITLDIYKVLPTGILFLVRVFHGIDTGGRVLSNLETKYFDTKHYSSLTPYTTAKWDTYKIAQKQWIKHTEAYQTWQTPFLFCLVF